MKVITVGDVFKQCNLTMNGLEHVKGLEVYEAEYDNRGWLTIKVKNWPNECTAPSFLMNISKDNNFAIDIENNEHYPRKQSKLTVVYVEWILSDV